MTRRKRTTSPDLKNKRMNDDVYKLRRKVMELIYEVKEFCDIPRIEVRITDGTRHILGQASLGDCVIWIPESTISSGYSLRHVVYHELVHAIYSVGHKARCPLMKPTVSLKEKHSKTKLKKLFLKYAKSTCKSHAFSLAA